MTIPHCDLKTGEIYGCEPGSNRWWHEQGHFEFNKLEITSRLIFYQGYALIVWMFTLTLSVLNKWMLVIALPSMLLYIGIEVYEEIWCDKYALKKLSSQE